MNETRRKRAQVLGSLGAPAEPRPLRSAARTSSLPTAAAMQLALAAAPFALFAPLALEACARPPSDEIRAESPNTGSFASASATHAPVASGSASIAASASASASASTSTSAEPSTRPMAPPGRPPGVSLRPAPSSSGRVIVKPPPPATPIPPIDKGPRVDGVELGVQATPRARGERST